MYIFASVDVHVCMRVFAHDKGTRAVQKSQIANNNKLSSGFSSFCGTKVCSLICLYVCIYVLKYAYIYGCIYIYGYIPLNIAFCCCFLSFFF